MPSIEEQLKSKIEELGNAFEAFKKANDAEIKEIKAKGQPDPLLAENVKKANDAIDQLDREIKELKTALNRRPTPTEIDEKVAKKFSNYKGVTPFLFNEHGFNPQADKEYKAALASYLRRGHEEKALSVGSDPDGGYLVRPEISDEIVKKVFESTPIRQIASVQTISTDALELGTDLDEVASGWVGETQPRSATNTPKVGMRRIPVHELYAQPQATQKLLDDAAIDIESWLSEKVAEKFSRDEAYAFVNGDGVHKPRGFLSYPAGSNDQQIEQINSGDNSAVTFDGMMDLEGALKSAYRNNAVFLMRRKTLAEVRKLKDGNGQYLWQPGLQVGQPSLLMGYPYFEAADMPQLAGGALPIAFGDFRAGYQIVDRIGIRVLRDPFTAKPYVLFYTTKRVGGDVKNFEAIKLLKIAAA